MQRALHWFSHFEIVYGICQHPPAEVPSSFVGWLSQHILAPEVPEMVQMSPKQTSLTRSATSTIGINDLRDMSETTASLYAGTDRLWATTDPGPTDIKGRHSHLSHNTGDWGRGGEP